MNIIRDILFVYYIVYILWLIFNRKSTLKSIWVTVGLTALLVLTTPIVSFAFSNYPYLLMAYLIISIVIFLMGLLNRDLKWQSKLGIPVVIGIILSFVYTANIREFKARFNFATQAWKYRIPTEPINTYQTKNLILSEMDEMKIQEYIDSIHICGDSINKWYKGDNIISNKDTVTNVLYGKKYKNNEIEFTHFIIEKKRINLKNDSLFDTRIGNYIYIKNELNNRFNFIKLSSFGSNYEKLDARLLEKLFNSNFNYVMGSRNYYSEIFGFEYRNAKFWKNLLEPSKKENKCI